MRPAVWPLALLPLVTACRFDFDRVHEAPDATPDAPPDAPPPPPTLACGSPPQFAIALPPGAGSGSGSGNPSNPLSALAAAADDTGYYTLAVDAAGDVHGFSYQFDGGQLAPRVVDAHVFSGADGTVATVPTSDGVLVSLVYGLPDAVGTALVPLDRQLAARGPVQHYLDWFGSDATIARAPDGTLAFLGDATDIAAKLVAADGTSLGSPHTVVDRSEGADEPTITASDTGFLVTWSAGTASPNEVHAEIFGPQLAAPVVASHTINAGQRFDGQTPRAAYATTQDRYLFAWWQKTSSSDEVWVSLRDGALTELHRIELSVHGKFPKIGAGKDDFLVVWEDNGPSSGLAAARVKFDGSVQPLLISGNGGDSLGWDVATRAGQPALIWLEDGATPRVWFDPLCN